MKTESTRRARLAGGALSLAATLALGGCFFGGGDDVPSTTTSGSTATVPASAQSVTGLVSFLRTLVNDETSEPLAIDASFATEQSETAEPETL